MLLQSQDEVLAVGFDHGVYAPSKQITKKVRERGLRCRMKVDLGLLDEVGRTRSKSESTHKHRDNLTVGLTDVREVLVLAGLGMLDLHFVMPVREPMEA